MAGEWEELEEKSAARTRTAAIVGAVVALAFIAFVHFSGGETKQQEPVSASTQEDRTELPPTVIAPSAQNAPGSIPSGGTATGRESHVGIYECTVNGQRAVSDRPCASDAQTRTLVVEQPDPRDAAVAQQRLWQAQQQQQSTSRNYAASSVPGGSNDVEPVVQGNASACADVDREIDQLNARMRHGYTSQEGEWLRAEWHRLQNRRTSLRCGR